MEKNAVLQCRESPPIGNLDGAPSDINDCQSLTLDTLVEHPVAPPAT